MKNKLVVPPSGEREGVGDKPAAISTAQSCLTLCNPEDYGQPGSSVHGVLQARILDWVAISFCSGSSPPRIKPESGGGFFTPEPPEKCTTVHPSGKQRNQTVSPWKAKLPKSTCQEEGPSVWQGSPSYFPRMLKQLVIQLKSGLPW